MFLPIPDIIFDDWFSVQTAIDRIRFNLGTETSPTFAGLTLTGLTASGLVGTNASKALESVTIGTGLDYTRPTLSLSHLGIEALTDPDGDKIVFWDDSETACKWLGVGNSIVITTTTLDTIQDIRTTATPTFAGLNLVKDRATILFEAENSISYGEIWFKVDDTYIGNVGGFGVDYGADVGGDLVIGAYNQDILLRTFADAAWHTRMVVANNGNVDFASGNIVTTGTIDAHAGKVLVEDNDTVAPDTQSNGYVGVAVVDGTARLYFSSGDTMYYIDGTAVEIEDIITGNPFPWLFWFTHTV